MPNASLTPILRCPFLFPLLLKPKNLAHLFKVRPSKYLEVTATMARKKKKSGAHLLQVYLSSQAKRLDTHRRRLNQTVPRHTLKPAPVVEMSALGQNLAPLGQSTPAVPGD